MTNESGSSSNVRMLGASTTMSVEQALRYVLQEDNLKDVIIIGYDPDGQLVIRSSAMSREQALFMVMQSQLHTLDRLD